MNFVFFTYRQYRAATLIAVLAVAGMLLAGCTKTITNPYEKDTRSRILSYKIVNMQTPVYGAINDSLKTITVYLGPDVYLDVLEPEIKVSEGAMVSPASGTFIEDMMDYFTNGRDIQYIVKGADGATATYTLKIISLQPELSFKEVSPDAENPVTYLHRYSYFTNFNVINLEPEVPFLFNENRYLNVALVAADGTGKEYPFAEGSTNHGSNLYCDLAYIVGYAKGVTDAPPAGLYYVKVRYYSKITTLQYPVKITY